MNLNYIHNKQVFIFDVDGTLYSQPKMRVLMGFRLLIYFVLHFWRMKELLAIYYFRKLRESEAYQSATMKEQIDVAAKKVGISAQKAEIAINKWMFEVPLDIMEKCSYKNLLDFIRKMQDEGKKLIIYSDYQADEKINKLNLNASMIFTPENPEIGALKPSKKAMKYILSQLDCDPESILYVGDRDEKDGVSAQYASIDYCDVKKLLSLLKGA